MHGEASSARRRIVAAVIPALDEEAALPGVLAELQAFDVVVVVDNGSRDRTAEVARAGGALVVSELRRGYGRACQKGIRVLLGLESPDCAGLGPVAALPLGELDVVVFLDADGSDVIEDLPALVGPILDGSAHFVVGARDADAASRAALTLQQRLGNAFACFLLRLLFRARWRDLGPFRALRVDALRHMELGDPDYGWNVEMHIKAAVVGLATREVAVRYRPRRAGMSKISGTLVGTLRAGWKILGWIVGWRVKLWFSSRRIPRFHERAPSAPR